MNSIGNAIKAGHGTGILYAGILGLALSDIIPTPADALYFHNQQKWKEQLAKKEITPEQFWRKELIGYYGYNFGWWLIFLGAVVSVKGDFRKKSEIAIGLLAAGAVVGVIAKNIQKDKELQKHIVYK